tara:strand:+ start:193 stop:651 length:459 start_codon:yes stop_codon:yes gene_type:complete
MPKEMKVIMENWNRYILQEAPLETVGDLRKLIKTHRAMEAGKELGKKAAEAAIEQIPVVSNIFSLWKGAQDAKEIVGKLYGAEDSFKSSTGLDKLNVDDDVSKIVDDPIEVAFINDLLKAMENMDDLDPIPDVNVELQKYLADKFNSNQVKK